MKPNLVKSLVLSAVCVCGGGNGRAQGTFENLGFEDATIVPIPLTDFIVASNALPGWRCYIGGTEVGGVHYNMFALAAPAISLHGTTSPDFQPLAGSYSVFLQSGLALTGAAIAQTGEIPADAQSVRFFANISSLQVTFAGQALLLSAVGSTPNYTIYGADVSPFAGLPGELRFTSPAGIAFLDNIFFSNVPIPEPSVFGMLGLGALLLGWPLRKKSKL